MSLVNLGRGAALERVQVGGMSAHAPLPRSARIGVRCKRASLELQRLGVNAPSDYRQKRHAAHRLTFVPLPDIPAGQSEVGVVSVYSQSAATVTQAGGVNGLPAFSSFVRPTAGATRSDLRDPSLRGACGS